MKTERERVTDRERETMKKPIYSLRHKKLEKIKFNQEILSTHPGNPLSVQTDKSHKHSVCVLWVVNLVLVTAGSSIKSP